MFWNVTTYSLLDFRRCFGGTCFLHVQDREGSRETKSSQQPAICMPGVLKETETLIPLLPKSFHTNTYTGSNWHFSMSVSPFWTQERYSHVRVRAKRHPSFLHEYYAEHYTPSGLYFVFDYCHKSRIIGLYCLPVNIVCIFWHIWTRLLVSCWALESEAIRRLRELLEAQLALNAYRGDFMLHSQTN